MAVETVITGGPLRVEKNNKAMTKIAIFLCLSLALLCAHISANRPCDMGSMCAGYEVTANDLNGQLYCCTFGFPMVSSMDPFKCECP
ncbi:hypothetical protein ElyMa_004356000 [Elysia marginata]|uniref:Uncharacterized protein n=1 Tax=Elysia marginata TaxID=1093978 RepID=A0AAV4H4B0_9GAST|nr:hypothetical protein ElyMa_004356000 [Elysia marginata]